MTDFFNFRRQLEEAKCGSKSSKTEEKLDPVGKADADIDNDGDVDSSDEYLKNRRKAISKAMKKEDKGPCWDGYKQVGTKMKDGKEVPNCVPEETQKEQVSEGYYDYPDYGPIGASEMAQTQLHFIKYAADDITRCLKMGCPMPEWYQNKLAKIEGDMEGLYSYMKGKTRKMRAHQSDRYSMGMSMYGEETQLNEDWFYDLVGVKMKDLYFVAKKGYRTNKKVYLQTLHSPTNFGTYWVRDPGDATYFIKKRDAEKAAKEHGGKVVTGVTEEAKSGDKEAYRKFFNSALKKFGVKSPAELKGEKEKEFYDYVDKNWKGDDEKSESVQIDEKSLARKINKILSFTADKPDEMRREIGKMSDDELLKLKGTANEKPGSGSARKLQIDLINREMKKRNLKESVIMEKTVPLNKLKKGQTYTVKMNGKKGKVKVDSIRMDGGEVMVKMTYMDNNIGKKGQSATQSFDQGGDDDVFMESVINEVLKPSDDVSKWIEDFYKSDAPQFKGKDKAERREMAVAAWLEARREAGYDVPPAPKD